MTQDAHTLLWPHCNYGCRSFSFHYKEAHRKANPVRVHVEFDGEIVNDNGRYLDIKVNCETRFVVDTEDEAFKVTPIKPVKTGHVGELWEVPGGTRWFAYWLGHPEGVGFKCVSGAILGHDAFFAKFPDAVCIL